MSEQNEVREKIAEIIRTKLSWKRFTVSRELANQILSIPEIKEALGREMMTGEEIERTIREFIPHLNSEYVEGLTCALTGHIPTQEQPKKKEVKTSDIVLNGHIEKETNFWITVHLPNSGMILDIMKRDLRRSNERTE